MGGDKRLSVGGAVRLASGVARLRRETFDFVVNIAGDVREVMLGWLIAPGGNCSVIFDAKSEQRRMIRHGMTNLVSVPVQIPTDEINIYSIVERVAARFGATVSAHPRVYDPSGHRYSHSATEKEVAIHMVASQRSREWPVARWRNLIGLIRGNNVGVTVLGAPSDRDRLLHDLAEVLDEQVRVVTGSLDGFFANLGKARAFVGLDSFAIHAAYALDVPSIMLNGSNRAEMWRPPGVKLLEGGRGLSCYPCFNKPICEDWERPYQCIQDIPEAAVIRLLEQLGVFAS